MRSALKFGRRPLVWELKTPHFVCRLPRKAARGRDASKLRRYMKIRSYQNSVLSKFDYSCRFYKTIDDDAILAALSDNVWHKTIYCTSKTVTVATSRSRDSAVEDAGEESYIRSSRLTLTTGAGQDFIF